MFQNNNLSKHRYVMVKMEHQNCISLMSLDQNKKVGFESLCDNIANHVRHRRLISSELINKFNRLTLSFVKNNIAFTSKSFDSLSDMILDYIRYEFESDNNKKRAYSYIRIYQSIYSFKMFQDDRSIVIKAHRESFEVSYSDMVKHIKESNCVTYKELQKKYGDNNLNENITLLITKGYVIEGGVDGDKYYILSKLGDELYKNLIVDGDYSWVDQWSNERILSLFVILNKLKSRAEIIEIKDVIRIVSHANEKSIKKFVSSVGQRYGCDNQVLLSEENMFSDIQFIDKDVIKIDNIFIETEY